MQGVDAALAATTACRATSAAATHALISVVNQKKLKSALVLPLLVPVSEKTRSLAPSQNAPFCSSAKARGKQGHRHAAWWQGRNGLRM